jgi:hypothetical protein
LAPPLPTLTFDPLSYGWGGKNGYYRIMAIHRGVWISILIVTGLTGAAFAFDGEKYLPEAKVTLAQARETALKTYPGKIVSEELEKESGGSGLRYSFVVRHHTDKHEVGIDGRPAQCWKTRSKARTPTELAGRQQSSG